ncbi:hypothetical protein [Capnocytophaga haemolytica]
MKRFIKISSILFVMALTFSACGVSRQFVPFTHKEPLEEGKGRIYVTDYRTGLSFFVYMNSAFIYCDSVPVGKLFRKGYLAFDVPEGQHTLYYGYQRKRKGVDNIQVDDIFNINVKAGEIYYFKAKLGGINYGIDPLKTVSGERRTKYRKKPRKNYIE